MKTTNKHERVNMVECTACGEYWVESRGQLYDECPCCGEKNTTENPVIKKTGICALEGAEYEKRKEELIRWWRQTIGVKLGLTAEKKED